MGAYPLPIGLRYQTRPGCEIRVLHSLVPQQLGSSRTPPGFEDVLAIDDVAYKRYVADMHEDSTKILYGPARR